MGPVHLCDRTPIAAITPHHPPASLDLPWKPVVMAPNGAELDEKFPEQFFVYSLLHVHAYVPMTPNTQVHMQILPFDSHLSARVRTVQAPTAVL